MNKFFLLCLIVILVFNGCAVPHLDKGELTKQMNILYDACGVIFEECKYLDGTLENDHPYIQLRKEYLTFLEKYNVVMTFNYIIYHLGYFERNFVNISDDYILKYIMSKIIKNNTSFEYDLIENINKEKIMDRVKHTKWAVEAYK